MRRHYSTMVGHTPDAHSSFVNAFTALFNSWKRIRSSSFARTVSCNIVGIFAGRGNDGRSAIQVYVFCLFFRPFPCNDIDSV